MLVASPLVRPPELGGQGRGEQGGVGADGHEGPAFGPPGGRGGAVGHEQPARLAVPPGRLPDQAESVDVGGRPGVARHAEVVAEVARADEQHVHPLQGGDRPDLLDGPARLDLHDGQDLVAGPVEGARVEPEAAGPVVGGHAPVAVGRVAQVPQGLGHLGGRLHAGQHDAGRAQVQDPAEPDAGGRLDPDHGRDAVGAGGRDDVADLLLPARAVLQVEHDPVHPGGGAHLGRDRRGGPDERAKGRLPGDHPGSQLAAVEGGA